MSRLAILASHPVQYCAPLFRALAQRLDLTVFYAHNATARDQAQAGFGVGFAWDVDLLSGYEHIFLTNVARDPGLGGFGRVDTPEIGRFLRAGQFDVLLLMGWYLKCFMQGLVAAKRLGVPVMVRGDSQLNTPRSVLKVAAKRVLYPHFLRQFDAALVVGKLNRAYWEHYGYPRERIFDAPHCVDNAFFAARATPTVRAELRARLGIPPEARSVLFAGKLEPLKRPLDVIEAVARVRFTQNLETHVIVAGAGRLDAELRERASALRTPLHMLGFCNQTAMPAAYAAADALVLPSSNETWGLVVNEALASGTPTLVSDAVGCAPDLLELLGEGAVYRLADTNDLANKLHATLRSPPRAEAIAAAYARFELGAVADRIAEVTRELSRGDGTAV